MHRREGGMTAIGWVLTLAFGGLFLLAGLRLGPVYMEHMKVMAAIQKVVEQHSGERSSITDIRNALAKRYNVEGITYPDFKQIKIAKEGAGVRITSKYDHVVPYIGNVNFLVAFDNYVDIPH